MKPGAVPRQLVVVAVILVCLLAVILVGPAILAQSGGGYDLSWSAIVGGGGMGVSGGNYDLGGGLGQPGAGTVTGGQYQLEGGFWHCFPLGSPDCQSISDRTKAYIPVIINPNQ